MRDGVLVGSNYFGIGHSSCQRHTHNRNVAWAETSKVAESQGANQRPPSEYT